MIRIIRPVDLLFLALVGSAAAGYVAGKNDVIGQIQRKIDAANDRRSVKNAQIMVDVWDNRIILGVAKDQDGKTQG